MKGEGPDSCAVLTATTSGHPMSGATGAMEDHPTSIQVSIRINNLCTKISKSTKKLKKTLYFAMIHSHLVYCINIYSCATDTCLKKLRIKQKEAIKIICNAGYSDHTAPLFAHL